jgi:hypothetical protein
MLRIGGQLLLDLAKSGIQVQSLKGAPLTFEDGAYCCRLLRADHAAAHLAYDGRQCVRDTGGASYLGQRNRHRAAFPGWDDPI